jgi:hypothetical protein
MSQRKKVQAQNPGLPDDLITNQKFQFGYIWESLGTEHFDTSYGYFVFLTVIWYTL